MSDLKKIFENFENAGTVPAGGFSKDDFNKNPKSKALIDIIRCAMENLKKKASEIFDEFNVNFNITATDKVDEPYVNAVNFDFKNGTDKQNLLVSLNFNFSKLASLPAPEAYSFVYSTLHSSLIEKRKSMPNANEYKFGKDVELEEENFAENDQNFDREGRYVKPKNIFIEYIKSFLRKLFGLDFDKTKIEQNAAIYSGKLSSNYESAASDIAKTFAENGITPTEVFDNPPDISSNKSLENNQEKQVVQQPESSKTLADQNFGSNKQISSVAPEFDSKVLSDALFASRYGKLVKQERHQQATYLLGVFSQDEFNSLKNGSDSEIRAFCEKFARKFLQNNGLDAASYNITYDKYDSKGYEKSAGSYIDYGKSGQTININIDQVKSVNNPAEIIMILTHELTHMVDSSINKAIGRTTSEGYGLLYNKIGGTGGLANIEMNESSEVYKYVKNLTEACYRLNPNERSAREGELIAVEFMKGMNPNSKMQSYIDSSIESYKRYQKAVISDYKSVSGLLTSAENFKKLARDVETKRIIDARIEYLKDLKNHGLLNVSGVEESIEIAQKLNEGELAEEGLSNG